MPRPQRRLLRPRVLACYIIDTLVFNPRLRLRLLTPSSSSACGGDWVARIGPRAPRHPEPCRQSPGDVRPRLGALSLHRNPGSTRSRGGAPVRRLTNTQPTALPVQRVRAMLHIVALLLAALAVDVRPFHVVSDAVESPEMAEIRPLAGPEGPTPQAQGAWAVQLVVVELLSAQ